MQWNFTWDVVSDSHHFNLCFAAVNSCYDIVNVLREKGYIAQVKDSKNCVIFDDGAYKRDQKPMNARIQQFCGVSQRIDTMRRPVLFSWHISTPFTWTTIFRAEIHCTTTKKWQNQIFYTSIPHQTMITEFSM